MSKKKVNRWDILVYKGLKELTAMDGISTFPHRNKDGNYCHASDVEKLEQQHAEMLAMLKKIAEHNHYYLQEHNVGHEDLLFEAIELIKKVEGGE